MSALTTTANVALAGSHCLCVDSLTSLATVANDCVSDSESEDDTVTANGTFYGAQSHEPEPSETDAEAHHDEAGEFGDVDIKRVLDSLGFMGCPIGEVLLPASTNLNPPTGDTAPQFRNLFWRQYHASRDLPGQLTASRLAAHDAAHNTAGAGRQALASSPGEWLQQFKMKALGVPVMDISTRILGPEMGTEVAAFLGTDGLGTPSEHGGSAQLGDAPNDGHHVIGSKCRRVPASTAHGRAAFLLDDEVSVSTPEHASSHQSDIGSEASDDDHVGQDFAEPWAQEKIAKLAFNGKM